MPLPVNASLLDACVLAVLHKGDTYGYRITQELAQAVGVSESALYPVLRRLLKDGALSTYDVNISGRNRRYYRLSPLGESRLQGYLLEWEAYKRGLDRILYEQTPPGQDDPEQSAQTQGNGGASK